MIDRCPACDAGSLDDFHKVEQVPTNSCLLLEDEGAARAFPRGDLVLAWCASCGFITNRAFDDRLAEYSGRYEETQSFSPRFVDFGRGLAKTWVDRYGLAGKRVLEIGCGKGEFLAWMVEAGIGSGVGIDPGVHPERLQGAAAQRLTFVADLYGREHADLEFDAVVCRHTLEHIHPVAEFLRSLRSNIGEGRRPVVLFELPDTLRVLQEVAFWDTYYEHCSYFTRGSLARLFRRCGFEVVSHELVFDDQYLLIEALPGAPADAVLPGESDVALVRDGVRRFRAGYADMVAKWAERIEGVAARGDSTVLWGGGSKAVAFLTALGRAATQVTAAVDINPNKQGRFIAGTGHPVLAPEALRRIQPGLVIAMNPIYRRDIREDLDRLALTGTELVWL